MPRLKDSIDYQVDIYLDEYLDWQENIDNDFNDVVVMERFLNYILRGDF